MIPLRPKALAAIHSSLGTLPSPGRLNSYQQSPPPPPKQNTCPSSMEDNKLPGCGTSTRNSAYLLIHQSQYTVTLNPLLPSSRTKATTHVPSTSISNTMPYANELQERKLKSSILRPNQTSLMFSPRPYWPLLQLHQQTHRLFKVL